MGAGFVTRGSGHWGDWRPPKSHDEAFCQAGAILGATYRCQGLESEGGQSIAGSIPGPGGSGTWQDTSWHLEQAQGTQPDAS